MRRACWQALALSILASCGTLGTEELEDVEQPHGGVGPFRPLTRAETGVTGTPAGRVLAVRDAVASPMVQGDHLFYTGAPALPDAMQAEDHPSGVVDWSLFEPPRIYRAEPLDTLGFGSGEVVLEASAAWEGPAVLDPWVVPLPNGGARMYYAGEGGIGVAEAASVQGAFERVGDGPVLEPAAGESLRRPSVVAHEGRFLLYFEVRREGAPPDIGLAESSDGLVFERIEGDLGLRRGPVDELPDEVGVGGPGVMAVDTPAGRRVIRMYLESHRADGSTNLSLAASLDGRSFDRLERPVLDVDVEMDARLGSPAPLALDERVTVLFYTAPLAQVGLETRAIVAAVAPRSFQLVSGE